MLKDLLESKNEGAVLSLFLSAPRRAFSVTELSKRLNMPYLKCSHVLNKLVEGEMLTAFSKRSKKYYLLNEKYALLGDIKTFWQKTGPKYQDELFFAINKLGKIKAAFLSGLFTGQPNLPVDLLIVGKVNLKKLDDFLKSAEKMMGQEINYSVMSVEEFILRRDTFDRFIKDIFDYKHLVVIDKLSGKP